MNAVDPKLPNVFARADAPVEGGLAGRRAQAFSSSLTLGLRLIWRRKFALLGVVGMTLALALLYLRQVTPLYTATSTVIIETRRTNVGPIAEVLGGLSSNQFVVQGEVEVLKSRGLAEKVVTSLKLTEVPFFNPDLEPPRRPGLLSYLNPIGYIPEDWRRFLSDALRGTARDPEAAEAGPVVTEDPVRVRAIRIFGANLLILNNRSSPVVDISFTAPTPALAAAVANAVAEQYLVMQLEAKFQAVERATRWLNERSAELKREVELAELAVETYRRQHNLISAERGPVAQQQLSELNSLLLAATARRSEASVRYERAREQVATARDGAALVEVLNSPVIHALRANEAELLRQLSDLSTRYGPRHPQIIKLEAGLKEIKDKISTEASRVIAALANEVAIARAREQAIERNFNELKRQVSTQNQAQVELRALEREAEASRALYEAFLSRFKETDTQRDMQTADARILSHAVLPRAPSSPRSLMILAIAGLTSALIGLALAFALEELDPGFRSATQIEEVLGIPVLGLTPEVSRSGGSARLIEAQIVDRPTSTFAESVRSIRAGLDLAAPPAGLRLLMVTSSQPSEGKSVMAYAIAAQTAQAQGKRVLVIDADLRKPSVHATASLPIAPGVSDLLAGEATAEQAVRPDPRCPGLFVLTAGRPLDRAVNPFDSRQFHALVEQFATAYDLIVIDTPPLLAVSDARVLIGLVDRVVFVVRWERTRRETVSHAVETIERLRPGITSAVLSRVNMRRHAAYSYGDSGQYYKAYSQYYAR